MGWKNRGPRRGKKSKSSKTEVRGNPRPQELVDLRAGLWNPNGFPASGQKHSDVLTELCLNELDFLCVVETKDRTAQSSRDGFMGSGGAVFGYCSSAAERAKTQSGFCIILKLSSWCPFRQ